MKQILLTPAQASTLWWLLLSTKEVTEDRALAVRCQQIMTKLEKAGLDKRIEAERQDRKKA